MFASAAFCHAGKKRSAFLARAAFPVSPARMRHPLLPLLALLATGLAALAETPAAPHNEQSAIGVCRAFFEAQVAYIRLDHDGDGIREYAQRFVSRSRTDDGLFAPMIATADHSPLWPLIAKARGRSWFAQPHNGYLFAILPRQGSAARGGAKEYIVNGHMIGGFAILAWPAKYGVTGRRTFMLGSDSSVYAKDLGPKTAGLAKRLTTFDPDTTWTVAAKGSQP